MCSDQRLPALMSRIGNLLECCHAFRVYGGSLELCSAGEQHCGPMYRFHDGSQFCGVALTRSAIKKEIIQFYGVLHI